MNKHLGSDWEDVRKEIYTPEQLAESELKAELVAEIIKLRKEAEITQSQLSELSGINQPVISRLEQGVTSPNLETIMKILVPLGKTLYIGDLDQNRL